MSVRYRLVLDQINEKAIQCGRSADEVVLVAVAKNCPVELVREVYDEGCRDFGESRVQEASDIIPLFPKDCRWHFIGSLQTNKVVKVVDRFCLIHSVDTLHLAKKISVVAQEKDVVQGILLQVNTSHELSKHGLSAEEWESVLDEMNGLPNLLIEGLMTMAPYTKDVEVIRRCFRDLRVLRDKWKGSGRMRDPEGFRHLSMGMSNDFLIAVEEGATLVRVGSAIFRGTSRT